MYNQGAKIGIIPEKTKFLAVFRSKKIRFSYKLSIFAP